MMQFDNAVKRFGENVLFELEKAGINSWVAGGSVRDYFMGIPIRTDYDLFFHDEDEYNLAKSHFLENNGEIKWESKNGCKIRYNDRLYDLVKKTFYKNPQEAIDSFDFTVSMFAVDTEKVYFGETSFIDLAKRQLIINKITYPASTLSRAFRYYKKGFTMCAGEMKKLFEFIQKSEIIEEVNSENNKNVSSGDLAVFFSGID